MNDVNFKNIYGPVPSRRLGRSLGIDLVPFKICTYDCIYCQLGKTTNKTIERKEYVPIDAVLEELKKKLKLCFTPDYISIAGSGEPTLNSRIGDLIIKLKALTNIPIAVLTNGSLLWMKEVQDELMAADLILPSLDAGDGNMFRHVNRPHIDISYEQMVEGIASFTNKFPKEVWLEIFLIGGFTGIVSEVEKIASIVQKISPARVQLNTVFRPPTEDFASSISMNDMLALKDFFPGRVEIISEFSGHAIYTGAKSTDRGKEIMTLLARRPCTLNDIATGLVMSPNEAAKELEHLLSNGSVLEQRVHERIYFKPVHGNGHNTQECKS